MTVFNQSNNALKNQTYQKLFNEIGNRLESMKTRQIVRTEIIKLKKEMEYLEERMAYVHPQLEETNSEIKRLENLLAQPKKELQILENEKNRLEQEHARVEKLENDIEKNQLTLEENKTKARQLKESITKQQSFFSNLEKQYNSYLEDKQKTHELSHELQSKIEALTQEISIMSNTRDILKGMIPENFDQDTYQEIQVNYKDLLNQYMNDMNQNMGLIQKNIQELKQSNIELKKQIDPLKKKIASYNVQIPSLKKEIGNVNDAETIVKEIKTLQESINTLSQSTQDMKKESYQFESEIQSLTQKIDSANKLKEKLDQQYAYFDKRKQQMDAVTDMTLEMTRLQETIQKNNIQIMTYQRMNQFMQPIYEQFVSTKTEIQTQVDAYYTIQEELIHFTDELGID